MDHRILTIDVEDWFHILDTPLTPRIEEWPTLHSRLEPNLRFLLELLERYRIKATLFWLGWAAERYPRLVRECAQAGHEIASHGYAHVKAQQVGPRGFASDTERAKKVLEDTVGKPVAGYRAPGFGITTQTPWAFDILAALRHTFDSSVFPAKRGHGGLQRGPLGPCIISTPSGPLAEIGISVVELAGLRVGLFGGGYLRLAPLPFIRWGLRRIARQGLPAVIYVHPREVDPDHPRLPLPLRRRFQCYVNLRSTHRKLEEICTQSGATFSTMSDYLRHRRMLERPRDIEDTQTALPR